MNTTASHPESNIDAEPTGPGTGPDMLAGLRELRRPADGRMLAGVAAGIARYLDVDVNIVRIVFVVLACLGGAALPLYVAGWLLIPEEGAEQSIASELISSLENRSR
ncbi:MAG TPA: PspC domain-containing protein [Streptosporangiaceae bacterium]|nr:PspC domain-containing protein [Streptosporangiaceae bacterium]